MFSKSTSVYALTAAPPTRTTSSRADARAALSSLAETHHWMPNTAAAISAASAKAAEPSNTQRGGCPAVVSSELITLQGR